MMFVISPLLALIALVTMPLSIVITVIDRASARRSSSSRSGRTPARSTPRSRRRSPGHALVQGVRPPAARSRRDFRAKNEELYEASFGAQFISGIIMPAMMFIGNLIYVAIAVVGGLRVASGLLSHRRRAGVHPVLAPVHPAAHPARLDGQPAAVGRRVGRARVRAARRGRGGARRRSSRTSAAAASARPPRVRGRLVPLRARQAAHRDLSLDGRSPGRPSRSSARPAPARPRS